MGNVSPGHAGESAWAHLRVPGRAQYIDWFWLFLPLRASLVVQKVKNPPTMCKTWVWSLGREDPPEKEMATDSSLLAWRIPWMGEACGQQSMGLQRVRHDWGANTHTLTPSAGFAGRGKGDGVLVPHPDGERGSQLTYSPRFWQQSGPQHAAEEGWLLVTQTCSSTPGCLFSRTTRWSSQWVVQGLPANSENRLSAALRGNHWNQLANNLIRWMGVLGAEKAFQVPIRRATAEVPDPPDTPTLSLMVLYSLKFYFLNSIILFFLIFIFYWTIIAVQYYVSYRYIQLQWFTILKKIYLFIWLCRVLVAAPRIFVASCRIFCWGPRILFLWHSGLVASRHGEY